MRTDPSRTRLTLAGIVSVGLVAAAVTVPSFAHQREGSARTAYERSTVADAMAAKGLAPDGHDHRHDDPRTKNALSRAGLTAGSRGPDDREAGRGQPHVRREEPGDGRPGADHGEGARRAGPGAAEPLRDGRRLLPPARRGDPLPGDRARHLRALQPGPEVPHRHRRPGLVGRPAVHRRGVHRAHAGRRVHVHAPLRRGSHPHRRRHPAHVARDGVPAPAHHRLRGVPRDRHRRLRSPARRRHRHPGGARVRRRAHPRDGLRVPRRRGALRQAVGQVRRRVRARRLQGPHADQRQGRRARGGAVRPPDARPGRLADVQGLAGAAVADPRGHLLEVDGALLARRAAGVRQPARRERPALHDLPAEAELVRRDDLDPPAGQADAAVRELHRRAVRRARARAGTASSPARGRPAR